MALAAATQAAPTIFNFQLTSTQAPPGVDVGSSSKAFTEGALTITASSFDTPADALTPPDLFSKTDSDPSETGLGLANDGDHEIDTAHFIQLDFSKVTPAASIIITISSIQGTAQGFNPPEDANVWFTTTPGSIAGANLRADLNGNAGVVQTVDVTAQANAGNFIDIQASHGNVLIETVAVTPGPPTANCVTISAVEFSPITPVTMTASGGCGGPYTFSATGLPPGLTMSSSGTISGTPTATGTFNYTVTLTDACGNTGTANCSVTVNPPVSANCVTIIAVEGVPITPVTMTASGGCGGPYTFTASLLPAGITLSSSGTFSGTPTVSGTFNYMVTIKDACGNTGTIKCSVTVNPPPTANCVTINATEGTAITPVTMVASGGCGGPYTFKATGLPPGLTMSSSGTISGTPTASGTFPYTVTVTDNCGDTGTVNCSVTVAPNSPCTINGVTISGTSWNSFPVPSGTSPLIWVHMHINKPSGVPTTGTTTVDFTGVTLTLNGTPYSIPDGVLIFDSSNPSTITTSFTGGKWVTLINPNFMSDEMFFTGAAIPVTASIAAGAKANLTYNVASSVTGLSFQWQWSAAVYTFWPTDWNLAMIQPYHSNFHAGTPLNTTVQKSLIQGPRGGGGSNFTGSWSATGNAACPH